MSTPNPFRPIAPAAGIDGDAGLADLEPADAATYTGRPAGIPEDAEEVPEDDQLVPGHRIRVVLEDGSSWTVCADNRDFLRWDKTAPRQKWDARAQPFLFQTFLAWAASRRAGLTSLDFGPFGDVCLEANDVKAEADDDTARPTR